MVGDRAGLAHQFATPTNRARALYRIPTAPNTKRTLELYHASEPLSNGFNWPGAGGISCKLCIEVPHSRGESPAAGGDDAAYLNFLQPLPFAERSFDLVILHRTLDELATSSHQHALNFDATNLLLRIAQVLVPRGLVAGCVDNRSKLKSAIRWVSRRETGSKDFVPAAHFNLRSLRKMLTGAGFDDVRLFTLLPDSSAPLKLVDIDPAVSKLAFRHELQIARHLWSSGGYFARRLAVELGLYAHMEEAVFFWAYRRC